MGVKAVMEGFTKIVGLQLGIENDPKVGIQIRIQRTIEIDRIAQLKLSTNYCELMLSFLFMGLLQPLCYKLHEVKDPVSFIFVALAPRTAPGKQQCLKIMFVNKN